MTLKLIFLIIGAVIGTAAFFPYLRDIFRRETQPHVYTWLIWLLTQGTAVVGIWYGGGRWGALNLYIGMIFILGIFLFSLKYGTKNITTWDTVILIAALGAIVVWWQLNQPLLAVIMISAIDLVGYIPSLRKSYHEPYSETLKSWMAWAVSDIFALIALSEYNALTMTYLATITIANVVLVIFCLWRRGVIMRLELKRNQKIL